MEHDNSHLDYPRDRQRTPLDVEGQEPTLQLLLQAFATRLKRTFAGTVARDPAGFKKLVIHLLRRELPPRPGRPNDPRLDAAVRLIKRGKSVRQVLRIQIPGFERLDVYSRYLAEKGLRAAIARRRRHTIRA